MGPKGGVRIVLQPHGGPSQLGALGFVPKRAHAPPLMARPFPQKGNPVDGQAPRRRERKPGRPGEACGVGELLLCPWTLAHGPCQRPHREGGRRHPCDVCPACIGRTEQTFRRSSIGTSFVACPSCGCQVDAPRLGPSHSHRYMRVRRCVGRQGQRRRQGSPTRRRVGRGHGQRVSMRELPTVGGHHPGPCHIHPTLVQDFASTPSRQRRGRRHGCSVPCPWHPLHFLEAPMDLPNAVQGRVEMGTSQVVPKGVLCCGPIGQLWRRS